MEKKIDNTVFSEISELEIEAIIDIEKIIGKLLNPVENILIKTVGKGGFKHNLGYVVKNGHIIALGLSRWYIDNNTNKQVNNFNKIIYKLPKSLKNLNHLKILDLSGNDLIIFSHTFEGLHSLQTLILSNNNIDALPETLINMKNLKVLDLGFNSMVTLPGWFGKLKSLEFLDLSQNKMKILSRKVGNLHLLKNINLQGNPFQEKDAQVAEMMQMKINTPNNRKF